MSNGALFTLTARRLSRMALSALMIGGLWASLALPSQATDKNSTAHLAEMPPLLMKTLQLTPQQQDKIRVISGEGRKKSLPMAKELQQKRKALRVYLMSPQATEKVALQRSEQIRSIYRRLGELRLHTWFAIRQQLTPQQLKKLEQADL